MPESNRPLRVFLCHSSDDKPAVRALYDRLVSCGVDAWLDEKKLLPGQYWRQEIPEAVHEADAVLVLLSKNSISKEGYIQKEIKFALDIALEKPEGTIYLIPARLEECNVPKNLSDWQWVDLFYDGKNFNEGEYERLLISLQLRAEYVGANPIVYHRQRVAGKDASTITVTKKLRKEQPAAEQAEPSKDEAKEPVHKRGEKTSRPKRIVTPITIVLGLGVVATVVSMILVIPRLMTWIETLPLTISSPETTPASALTNSQPSTQTPYPANKRDETMVLVPAGNFTMGSKSGNADEKPVRSVYLDAFYIDAYEVTNALYIACVDAGECEKPGNTGSHTHASYYGNSEFDNYPVVFVDWNMAKTYCVWRGERLPSEAEWEKAARGTDGRTYPWGEGIDCTQANYSNCMGDTTAVGSYTEGKSVYGAFDMAGNVGEWVADWYDVYPGGDPNATNEFGQTYRVLRGGSWNDYGNNVRATSRGWNTPSSANSLTGFRCARSLP